MQVQKAQELIESGIIGEPYFAQANYWESLGRYANYASTFTVLIQVQKAKELIESGIIGEPYFAQANYSASIESLRYKLVF